MAKIHGDIQQLGGEVLAVSFASPTKIASFFKKDPLPFPIVSDESHAAYAAFGLGRTSAAALLRPGIIARFLGLIFRGWIPTLPDKDADLWQLGGDFILDRADRLCYAYSSNDALDHATNEVLLVAFRQAVGADIG